MAGNAAGDAWNPDQYARFSAERSQPFYDLLALIQPKLDPAKPSPWRAVDLGSGPGDLTRVLHERLGLTETVGLDSSTAMLARSQGVAGGGLRFEEGDISTFDPAGRYDIVFSNAALQWVPDHPRLLERITRGLPPGGQIAVQVPANDDHPSHQMAHEFAAEPLFRDALAGHVRRSFILTPEAYATLLDGLGYRAQHVRLQVYSHHLGGPEDVIEWTKGTLLTDYQRRLPADLYEAFLTAYRQRLLPRLSQARPFFYPFKRILFWAQR